METTTHKTGLILTGGGARAAYQVGVLNAISMILLEAGWPVHSNPFPIICGTSASLQSLSHHLRHLGRRHQWHCAGLPRR